MGVAGLMTERPQRMFFAGGPNVLGPAGHREGLHCPESETEGP